MPTLREGLQDLLSFGQYSAKAFQRDVNKINAGFLTGFSNGVEKFANWEKEKVPEFYNAFQLDPDAKVAIPGTATKTDPDPSSGSDPDPGSGSGSDADPGSGSGSDADPGSGSGSGSGVSRRSSARSLTLKYPDAPLASQYGMDAATAYQESLVNSAHQREVRDLIAAGLNPVLSATGGNGAASFAGAALMAPSGSGSSAQSSTSKLIKVGSAVASAILTFTGNYRAASAAKSLGSALSSVVD